MPRFAPYAGYLPAAQRSEGIARPANCLATSGWRAINYPSLLAPHRCGVCSGELVGFTGAGIRVIQTLTLSRGFCRPPSRTHLPTDPALPTCCFPLWLSPPGRSVDPEARSFRWLSDFESGYWPPFSRRTSADYHDHSPGPQIGRPFFCIAGHTVHDPAGGRQRPPYAFRTPTVGGPPPR